eukprot:gene10199-21260_t
MLAFGDKLLVPKGYVNKIETVPVEEESFQSIKIRKLSKQEKALLVELQRTRENIADELERLGSSQGTIRLSYDRTSSNASQNFPRAPTASSDYIRGKSAFQDNSTLQMSSNNNINRIPTSSFRTSTPGYNDFDIEGWPSTNTLNSNIHRHSSKMSTRNDSTRSVTTATTVISNNKRRFLGTAPARISSELAIKSSIDSLPVLSATKQMPIKLPIFHLPTVSRPNTMSSSTSITNNFNTLTDTRRLLSGAERILYLIKDMNAKEMNYMKSYLSLSDRDVEYFINVLAHKAQNPNKPIHEIDVSDRSIFDIVGDNHDEDDDNESIFKQHQAQLQLQQQQQSMSSKYSPSRKLSSASSTYSDYSARTWTSTSAASATSASVLGGRLNSAIATATATATTTGSNATTSTITKKKTVNNVSFYNTIDHMDGSGTGGDGVGVSRPVSVSSQRFSRTEPVSKSVSMSKSTDIHSNTHTHTISHSRPSTQSSATSSSSSVLFAEAFSRTQQQQQLSLSSPLSSPYLYKSTTDNTMKKSSSYYIPKNSTTSKTSSHQHQQQQRRRRVPNSSSSSMNGTENKRAKDFMFSIAAERMQSALSKLFKKDLLRGWKAWTTAILQDHIIQKYEYLLIFYRYRSLKKRYLKLTKDIRELKAACLLQRVERGRRARRRARIERKKRNKNLSATIIQCMCRRRVALNKVNLLRVEKQKLESAIHIQKHIRKFLALLYVCNIRIKMRQQLAAIRLQARMRGILIRKNIYKKRSEVEEYRAWRKEAAIKIEKVYRGHRGRIMTRIRLQERRKKMKRLNTAATKIQCFIRQHQARAVFRSKKKERYDNWVIAARAVQELWSEDSNNWFYLTMRTNTAQWEPPSTGYTKADTRLVLSNGDIIDDPAILEKNLRTSALQKCSECADRLATRKCNECEDLYCTKCYKAAHTTGTRKKHTWAATGILDCTECELKLAEKWCVTCDEAFCDSCWRKVHTKGKRRFHPFSSVDSDGNVESKAFTIDGEE